MQHNATITNVPRSVTGASTRALYCAFVILFRVILEFCFVDFVAPVYEHEGYLQIYNLAKYIESWIWFLLLLLMTPHSIARPSDFYINYFFLCFFSPLLILFGISDAERTFIYSSILIFIVVRIISLCRDIRAPVFKQGRIILLVIIAFFLLSVTGWMVISGGVGLFNLDLMRVYDFRDEAGGLIDIGPMAYANTWSTNVIGPAALAIALFKRRFITALLLCSLFILWFGINTHKSVLFFPLVTIFFWFWLRRSTSTTYLPVVLCIVLAMALGAFFVFDNSFVGGMLIRRVFFVPPMLSLTYFDFFSENKFVFWSSSIFSSFVEYPYFTEPAKLIGHYLGWDAHANNSFLATGYMHAGILGMVLYGVVVGLIFRFIDSMARYRIPTWVALSFTFAPVHTLLINADLLTSLLSHGLGLALVLLLFFNSDSQDKLLPSTKQSPR